MAIASFISGIFIDLDHIIDYLLANRFTIEWRRFSSFIREKEYWRLDSRNRKINLIFHGWEWLLILTILAMLTHWNALLTGVLIGYEHHLILDVFNNKPKSWLDTFLGYSLLWRWKKRALTHSP